jgi:hypothetical protein
MAFITYQTNADYLIDSVRLQVGDTDSSRFSDSLIRSAIITGVKMLQKRWKNRYMVYASGVVQTPQPSDLPIVAGYVYASLPEGTGLIPSDLAENDLFRNPFYIFVDPGVNISQEDEYPIILAASIILQRAKFMSSSAVFQNWSDGEFSFSNVASARAYEASLGTLNAELDAYFRKRLAGATRTSFAQWNI